MVCNGFIFISPEKYAAGNGIFYDSDYVYENALKNYILKRKLYLYIR